MANQHNVEIPKNIVFINFLDLRLKSVLGADISGMSYDHITNIVTVHFETASTANDALAQTIVEQHNTLEVNPDKASIFANGTDTVEFETIVTNGATVQVTVMREGELYMSPTVTPYPDTGLHKVRLNTQIKGFYQIEVVDVNSHQSGYYEVPAI